MESVYDRFISYDFEGNTSFQEGLKNIQDRGIENILKLKIFYYNRFIEPIDLEGYRQWSSSHNSPAVSEVGLSDCLESRRLEMANHDTKPMEQSDNAILNSKDDSNLSESSGNLTFAEVFRLIEAGEEVPGIQKLDIRPSQQTPTVSQMSRRLKPWERNDTPNIQMSPASE